MLRGLRCYFHLTGSHDPFIYTPRCGRWSSRYCATDCWRVAQTRRYYARGPVCDAPGADRAPAQSRGSSFRGFCERPRETRDWSTRRLADSGHCWNSPPRTPPLSPRHYSCTSRREMWWYTCIEQMFTFVNALKY